MSVKLCESVDTQSRWGHAAAFAAVALLLSTVTPTDGKAETSPDCQVSKVRLADLATDSDLAVLVKHDRLAGSFLVRLLGQLPSRMTHDDERQRMMSADFAIGLPDVEPARVRVFWGFKATNQLCGFERALVVGQPELDAIEQSTYAPLPADRTPLSKVPDPEPTPPAEREPYARRERPSEPEPGVVIETLTRAEREQLLRVAAGVTAFEQTQAKCFYEPIVQPSLEQLDDAMTSRYRGLWSQLKRESENSVKVMQSIARLGVGASEMNPKAQPTGTMALCRTAGLLIPQALTAAGHIVGFDPALFSESGRLIKNGGRPR